MKYGTILKIAWLKVEPYFLNFQNKRWLVRDTTQQVPNQCLTPQRLIEMSMFRWGGENLHIQGNDWKTSMHKMITEHLLLMERQLEYLTNKEICSSSKSIFISKEFK